MGKKKVFYYSSRDGKTRIHAVRHMPDKKPVAVLQIAHGMVEFIDRYDGFAEYLSSQGIIVTGNDHLGHGNSVISPQKYGYFAEEEGNWAVLADMRTLTRMTKEEFPGLPYFLLGHSMGSFYVRQYLCQFGEELDGAIIMGTGDQPYALVKSGMALTRMMAVKKGWEYRSTTVDDLAFGGYNKKFEPARTKYDWLTRDEAVVDAYCADERCGFIFTLNAYYNMFLGISRLHDRRFLAKMPRSLPVLFVSGEEDPVGDFGRGVIRVARSFRQLGMEHVTLKLYPGARHEILNELNRKDVYRDICYWIKKRLQ